MGQILFPKRRLNCSLLEKINNHWIAGMVFVCVCRMCVCVGEEYLGGEYKASFLKCVFNPNGSLSSKTV